MKTLFFLPVFNQFREFPRVLDELASCDLPVDEILLVNNGSSDGSEDLVHKSGYPYLDMPKNLGSGYSIICATDWALERDYSVFGMLASNGKMLPREMHRVVGPIHSGECDYVTGSRFLPGGDSPNLTPFRRASIPLVNVGVWGLCGVRLTDATCGYRAYRLDLVRRARFDWHAAWLYTYGVEYYLYAKVVYDRSIRWKEVPITMAYPTAGPVSKIRPGVDWLAMLVPWVVARVDGKGFAPA